MNFDKFLEAIEIIIDEKLKGLKFNYVINGTVTSVIDTNTYKVNLYDNIETLNAMNGQKYSVGDVVYIIVFNNNYSDKAIVCKATR